MLTFFKNKVQWKIYYVSQTLDDANFYLNRGQKNIEYVAKAEASIAAGMSVEEAYNCTDHACAPWNRKNGARCTQSTRLRSLTRCGLRNATERSLSCGG